MRIEQAIHGYSDGHRLLAASTDLPREARHAAHGLSDLSGQYAVEGFEEYLSGYPVPGTALFAFAKTWYAAEMERPGCVWTHTLLVPAGDLGAVPHPAALCALFRRPAGPSAWGDYESPLTFTPGADAEGVGPPRPPAAAAPLVAALYGTPGAGVLLPADDARLYEGLALEVWAQQWSSLRASFAFCTGAIAARSVAGRGFDLQVVPNATAREVRRELPAATVLAPPWSRGTDGLHDWVAAAAADLLGEGRCRFRAFLHRVGRDFPPGRDGFAALAELYQFGGERRLPELVEFVTARYPTPAEARGLKRALFGGRAPLAAEMVPGTSEGDILVAAATARSAEAFDPADLDLEERAKALWAGERAEGLRLVDHLARNDHNALGERLIIALARSLGPDEAARVAESAPALAATVARLNPQAAASPDLWRGPDDRQRTLFDAATTGKETPPELRRGIVGAMLRAGSDAVAELAGRQFGADAAAAVLDWFDGSDLTSPTHLSPRWRRVLAANTGASVDWLASQADPREASAALVADLTSPHARDAHHRGPSPWLKPSRGAADPAAALRLRAFHLALGFDNPGPGSDELVARAFAPVHAALAEDRLGYEQWSWLEDRVPSLSWLRNWDRCERLRRGLAEQFVRHGWPAAQYVRCAADDGMLRDMLESCRKAEGGRSLLRLLDEALSSGDLKTDGERRRVLKKYV